VKLTSLINALAKAHNFHLAMDLAKVSAINIGNQ
jgi:hypothetical protein